MTTKQHPKRIKTKLTYANVMATIAAFFAIAGGGAMAASHLGHNSVGSAQLKAGAVTGAKVRDHSLTGADVVASTLGKVPAAAHADSATHADSAASADHATTAGSATQADDAKHADTAVFAETAKAAVTAASAYGLSPNEQLRLVGEDGEPGYGPGTKVTDFVGFYIDHEGIVHLEGAVGTTTEFEALVTMLPDGYHPVEAQRFYGISGKSSAYAYVSRAGAVEIYGAAKGEEVSLDGITWRADTRAEA
jgi:hypothetical protein